MFCVRRPRFSCQPVFRLFATTRGPVSQGMRSSLTYSRNLSDMSASTPQSDTNVTNTGENTTVVDGQTFKTVQEGLAKILIPHDDSSQTTKKTSAGGDEQSVFYNSIQQFNRDLSVLAVKVFAEDFLSVRNAARERKATLARSKKKKKENAVSVEQSSKRKFEEVSNSAELDSEPKKAKLEEGDVPTETLIPDSHSPKASPLTTSNSTNAANQEGVATDSIEKKTDFRILDALSATGLRALRYAKEVPEVTLVTANDLSGDAVQSIRRNVDYNGVRNTVFPILGNAAGHMYWIGTEQQPKMPDGSRGRYDVIDLDPYGTAAPFIDSAVQALSDGGMLSVTCTDSAIFASVGYLEKTFAQYGGIPWKGPQSHEAGLRLIIHSVATSAARYGLAIEPLLSLSIDYYTRAFIRIRKSANEVKFLPGKTMVVYNCDSGCHAYIAQHMVRTQAKLNKKGDTMYHFTAAQAPTAAPVCEHCGYKMHIAGPMWGGPLHNPFFVQRLIDRLPETDPDIYGTLPRIEGMLNVALHETLLSPEINHVKNSSAQTGENLATGETVTEDSRTSISSQQTNKPFERLNPALPDYHPFFFTATDVSRVIHCNVPPDAAIRGALMHLGYRVTRSHTRPGSIKTDAPYSVIWEVMRAWVKQRAPLKEGAIKEGTPGWSIFKKENHHVVDKVEVGLKDLLEDKASVKAVMGMVEELRRSRSANKEALAGDTANQTGNGEQVHCDVARTADGGLKNVVFDEILGRDPDKRKLVRYQHNPRENWGPQARAK